MLSGMCWPALCAAFETTYATFRAKGDISVCKLPLNTWYVYYENTEEQLCYIYFPHARKNTKIIAREIFMVDKQLYYLTAEDQTT